jgi:hypothetical protein
MGISAAAVADYVDRALESMSGIVRGLGDEAANRRPDLPGANSPYAILRHCLGVMDYWGGEVIAGRAVQRDRDAEFRASGRTADLIAAADAARAAFRADLVGADLAASPLGTHPTADLGSLEMASRGHALLHVMEEICQHLGQLEITRDLLRASGGQPTS